MGGGSKTTNTTSSANGSAQAWAMPYAKQGAGSVQGVFDQAQPGLQGLTNTAQNDLVPNLVGQYHGGMGAAQQATNHYGNVLSGQYMNGNPYLQQMINRSNSDIQDRVNGQYSMNGRYGSEAHDQVLSRELANNENQYRYQNYTTEAGRMDNAAQGAGQQNLANVAQALAGIGQGAQLPYTGSSSLANSMGALFNGGTSQGKEVKKGPGLLQSLIQAGSNAAAAYAQSGCDIRLKENIVLNHVDPDGLAFYDFTYKPEFGLAEGIQTNLPMAQDVAKLRPWALGTGWNGYMTIYPGKL